MSKGCNGCLTTNRSRTVVGVVMSRASSSSASGTAGGRVLAGVLVGAGVGDDQLLGGRADRVEQQLPVLGTDVALAGHRVAGQHVVAVDDAQPREHAVVEADQADHPVRHRPHRHHRAHRQRAGAEVGPGRPCRPGGGPSSARMSGSRITVSAARAGRRRARRPNSRCIWLVCQASSSSTRVSRLMPSVSAASQSRSGRGAGERVDDVRCSRSTYSASCPASSTRLLLTSSSGSVDADPGVRVVGHRDPGQHPVDAESPGVVDEVDAERLAVLAGRNPSGCSPAAPIG